LNRRPLFTLAYAVQLGYDPNLRGLIGRKIINWLTTHEQARWRTEARAAGMNENVLTRLKGLAAVSGPLSAGQLRSLSAQSNLALNLPTTNQVVDLIKKSGYLENDIFLPPEPDLFAASLLHLILRDASDQAGAWLWHALENSKSINHALERLGRLSYDLENILEHSNPAKDLAKEVEGKVEPCQRLAKALTEPYLPMGLRPLAVAVWRTLANANRGDEATEALYLSNLSVHLAETGERSGGLQAIQRAVAVYERLAQANPAAYEPDLALSLTNLSNRLAETGERSGGLQAIQRAVAVYERLAQANPAAYEPDLAGSLTNLSIRLAETGERSGGLKAIQRAIELIQPYAQPGTQFSDWLATMELILHRLKGTSDP
jgi:hypothetical protein